MSKNACRYKRKISIRKYREPKLKYFIYEINRKKKNKKRNKEEQVVIQKTTPTQPTNLVEISVINDFIDNQELEIFTNYSQELFTPEDGGIGIMGINENERTGLSPAQLISFKIGNILQPLRLMRPITKESIKINTIESVGNMGKNNSKQDSSFLTPYTDSINIDGYLLDEIIIEGDLIKDREVIKQQLKNYFSQALQAV